MEKVTFLKTPMYVWTEPPKGVLHPVSFKMFEQVQCVKFTWIYLQIMAEIEYDISKYVFICA